MFQEKCDKLPGKRGHGEEKGTWRYKPVCDCAEVGAIYLRPDNSLCSGREIGDYK